MNNKDLKEKFVRLANDFAKPYDISDEVSREINSIIEVGIEKLERIPRDQRSNKILKSEEVLGRLIEEMKSIANKRSSSNKILESQDLDEAKDKLCPTWPCG